MATVPKKEVFVVLVIPESNQISSLAGISLEIIAPIGENRDFADGQHIIIASFSDIDECMAYSDALHWIYSFGCAGAVNTHLPDISFGVISEWLNTVYSKLLSYFDPISDESENKAYCVLFDKKCDFPHNSVMNVGIFPDRQTQPCKCFSIENGEVRLTSAIPTEIFCIQGKTREIAHNRAMAFLKTYPALAPFIETKHMSIGL